VGINQKIMETNKYIKEDRYLKAKKKVEAYKGFYWHLAVYVIVNSFITVNRLISNVFEGGQSYVDAFLSLETFFIWVPWGIGVLIHGIFVFDGFKFLQEKTGKNVR